MTIRTGIILLAIVLLCCDEKMELVQPTDGKQHSDSDNIDVILQTDYCQFNSTLVLRVGDKKYGREYTAGILCEFSTVHGAIASGERIYIDIIPNNITGDTVTTFDFTTRIGGIDGMGGEITEYNNITRQKLPLKLR